MECLKAQCSEGEFLEHYKTYRECLLLGNFATGAAVPALKLRDAAELQQYVGEKLNSAQSPKLLTFREPKNRFQGKN
jgi:hypothetical protein